MMKRWIPRLSAAAAAAALLCGYTYSNGLIDWQYFGTVVAPNTLPYASQGMPTIAEFSHNLPAALPALPADLASRIAFLLPEGKDIRTNAQGLIPDTDDKTNVRFKEDAEVWVTFVTEGAGYRNAVGYFMYDPANPPTKVADVKEKIIFANASLSGSGGGMNAAGAKFQDTVYLGTFKAGQALGFVIAADGFSETGRLVDGKRTTGVRDNESAKTIFYTLRNLNPEASSAQNLNVHTIMLKDASDSSDTYQRIVLGFEDINRESGGDHDFNDVVLAVHVTPRRAIANIDTLQPLAAASDPDSDGDGVKDSLDEFPNDPTRAFSRYYPGADTWGTLAFEDQWPKRGDYDMNDVVMRYRTREIMNAQRQVVGLSIDYRLDARGGINASGFGVNLPGIAAKLVASATLSENGSGAAPLAVEAGQSEATFVITPSVLKQMPFSADANCAYANTLAACPATPTVPFHLEVNFTTPQASTLFASPYNPFIFASDKRGIEVHLPGKAPTALADKSLFGTGDDATKAGTSTTYMDAQRRPWALDLPVLWAYPLERTDLLQAYPNFATWATSNGANARDWYVSGTVPQFIYSKP